LEAIFSGEFIGRFHSIMPSTSSRKAKTRQPKWLLASAAVLAVLLVVLFHQSFEAGKVAFSNDAPLGMMAADEQLMPQQLFGEWDDLNSIGAYAGSASPSVSALVKSAWEVTLQRPYGALGFSNSYVPIGLFILGLGALVFFNQLKFSPLATLIGALAIVLNSTFFGGAAWGIAAPEIAMGFNFFAMALVMVNTAETPWLICWIRFALAGLCVGMNVMETPDIGAIASLYVAAFVFFRAFADEEGAAVKKFARSTSRVAIVAFFAGFIALQAVVGVVGVAITGVASQNSPDKAANWDWATQWSLPKIETLGLYVPGLFGYKLDTPNDMPLSLQPAYNGGVYWGGMGRAPVNDRFLDSGTQGPLPDPQWMRQTGSANYCGVLVALIGLWTIAQSFRRENSPFSATQKRFIWFWTGVLILSLLLAWGRFAPFYALLYHLPYFSTIRNPTKFIIFLNWAGVILFTYGIDAFSRIYLNPLTQPAPVRGSWGKISIFDHSWIFASVGLFILCLVGWIEYDAHKTALIKYLQKVGFSDETLAAQIASFSIGQAGWFIALLAVAIGLVTLVITGWFSGPRAKILGTVLVAFLLFDLIRADLPYVIHWDYFKKYEVGSLNPVETFLRDKPYEHRVAALQFPVQAQLRSYDNYFSGLGLYAIEWAQQHFPYYNIQSLDVIQMPRPPQDLANYMAALSPQTINQATLYARLWELTNTRYLLGPAGFLNVLNQQLDPGKERFRIAERFDLIAKTNVDQSEGLTAEDLTAVSSPDGDLAVFDFTGALPRAKLYSNWQVNTNDQTVLNTLADQNFDPAKTVLVSTPENNLPPVATNQNSGAVEFKSYAPRNIVLDAQTITPSILLLNDKYDPHWRVTVDGQPAQLLRCNYIMRGVYLTPGDHTVRFHFRLPDKLLYVTLFAMFVGIVFSVVLLVHRRRHLEN
jgi:hypothetical protein